MLLFILKLSKEMQLLPLSDGKKKNKPILVSLFKKVPVEYSFTIYYTVLVSVKWIYLEWLVTRNNSLFFFF